VGVSIGLSARGDSSELAMSVLKRSDLAMYEAKRLGKNRAVWFDADMERASLEQSRLAAEIRAGLGRGEFVPHFQPLLDLASQRVRGFEVLARWVHPERGTLGTDAFLAVAKSSGLIAELSMTVMRSAFLQAVHWPCELIVAVNVSPTQLKDPRFADRLFALMRETRFAASRLEVEVSEQAMLVDNHQTLTTIHRLRAAGTRISLDDFGTGYAALSQFHEMPFDRIKIDRNFVSSLRSDKHSDAIVQAITALGKTLSLPITAEGIEEESMQDLLVALGATEGQGWLYGEALPGIEAAREYLELDQAQLSAIGTAARPALRRAKMA
jgi:predicted signal transduction protein with EAL and GGDEF domain